jgi:hypothetical protein
MVANRTAGQVQPRSTALRNNLETGAVDHAVRVIHQICCFAGSFDLLDEFRDRDLCAAIERHVTAALFDRLIHDFSFQGISDEIAENYMQRHGQATWPASRPLSTWAAINRPCAARPLEDHHLRCWPAQACGGRALGT